MASLRKRHVDSAVRVGRRIVHARGSLPQRELADTVGVSAAYISRIERGQRVPTLQLLERIAEALGVELTWLRGQNTTAGDGRHRPVSVAAIEIELESIEAALARIRDHLRSSGR